MADLAYPRLIKRVRAVLIDSVLVPVTVLAIVAVGAALDVSNPSLKLFLLLGPIFILEPGLVAFTGGTIGHHLQGLRVTTLDGTKNINILAATLRFAVKVALGWASLILVLTTARHQAVHDFLARSLVVHKNISGLPDFEVLRERRSDQPDFVYPAIWRRVIVILLYWVALTILLGVAIVIASSAECLDGQHCTTRDKLVELVLSVIWLVGVGWVTVIGWIGKLFGCRRRLRETAA